MSSTNLKFIYGNMLRTAELRIPVRVMVSSDMASLLNAWQTYLRMDALCITISLVNIVATTMEFSFVQRSSDNRHRFPLNIYNILVARSGYGKSDVTNLIRNVLNFLRSASGTETDVCLDEFTKAGLMDALKKCTKIFITDEADMTFADVGLFHCFPKPANENNCRPLTMMLYDRVSCPYVRKLSNKTVIIEQSKLNLLGLSTGEIMGSVVSRLKAGGSWDPMIGRFSWWVLDGPPIMEPLDEPILDPSIPSIEQFCLAASMFRTCTFIYEHDALKRIVQWGNVMRQKSYDHRNDAILSSILGKSIQHVHRYAAFLQTIEYAHDMSTVYAERFKEFPSARGVVDHQYIDRIHGIFIELFKCPDASAKEHTQYTISLEVVERAIDLTSGLIQQLKIFMDDTNAPAAISSVTSTMPEVCAGNKQPTSSRKADTLTNSSVNAKYVSTEKLRRLAGEILLFPTVCFTITQLHANSLIHNSATADIRCVLEYLMACDLLDCVRKGIKTTRRSTAVYVKRLPYCNEDGCVEDDHRIIFQEKLDEFNCNDRTLDVNEYLQKSCLVELDAIGHVTDELVDYLSQREYVKTDLTPLYTLKAKGEKANMKSNQDRIGAGMESLVQSEESVCSDSTVENQRKRSGPRTTISDNDLANSPLPVSVLPANESLKQRTDSVSSVSFETDINGGLNMGGSSNGSSTSCCPENDPGLAGMLAHMPVAAAPMSLSENSVMHKDDVPQGKGEEASSNTDTCSASEPLISTSNDIREGFHSPPSCRLRSKKRVNYQQSPRNELVTKNNKRKRLGEPK